MRWQLCHLQRGAEQNAGVCLEVTNTVIPQGSSPVLSQPGSQRAHLNDPLTQRLRFMASAASHARSVRTTRTAALAALPQQWSWLGLSRGSLLPHDCSLGLSLPGSKSLLCHRKQKLLFLSPDQLLHVPQKPLQRGAKPKQMRIWLCYSSGLS